MRGDLGAAGCSLRIYEDLIDECIYDEDESEYLKYILIQSQKMQQYGKIIEAEINRRQY